LVTAVPVSYSVCRTGAGECRTKPGWDGGEKCESKEGCLEYPEELPSGGDGEVST
jgi:hypothetical protein